MAISDRLGVGRIKHLEVKSLWLQERVKANDILPEKVGTEFNEADRNTKVHSAPRFNFLLPLLGIADYKQNVGHSPSDGKTVGGLRISKKTLALAVALGELMDRGAAADVQPMSSCVVPSVVSVGSPASNWTTTSWKPAAICAMMIFFLGVARGIYLHSWWTRKPPKHRRAVDGATSPLSPEEVAEEAVGHMKKKSRRVDKSTQSHVRYTWMNTQPRFAPLPDAGHGCWNG